MQYVDYGNTEEVSNHDLGILPVEYSTQTLKEQATQVELYGVNLPDDSDLMVEVIHRIKEWNDCARGPLKCVCRSFFI